MSYIAQKHSCAQYGCSRTRSVRYVPDLGKHMPRRIHTDRKQIEMKVADHSPLDASEVDAFAGFTSGGEGLVGGGLRWGLAGVLVAAG